MANKDLKYFMRSTEAEVVTVPGPESIKDEEGKVIQLEIKVLPQADIDKINDMYRERRVATDRKGNPLVYNGEAVWKTEKNNAKATRHMIVEALQYPNLKDKDLMEYYKCMDVTDMPYLVFPKADEYQYVLKAVMKVLGLIEDEDGEKEDLKDAKN